MNFRFRIFRRFLFSTAKLVNKYSLRLLFKLQDEDESKHIENNSAVTKKIGFNTLVDGPPQHWVDLVTRYAPQLLYDQKNYQLHDLNNKKLSAAAGNILPANMGNADDTLSELNLEQKVQSNVEFYSEEYVEKSEKRKKESEQSIVKKVSIFAKDKILDRTLLNKFHKTKPPSSVKNNVTGDLNIKQSNYGFRDNSESSNSSAKYIKTTPLSESSIAKRILTSSADKSNIVKKIFSSNKTNGVTDHGSSESKSVKTVVPPYTNSASFNNDMSSDSNHFTNELNIRNSPGKATIEENSFYNQQVVENYCSATFWINEKESASHPAYTRALQGRPISAVETDAAQMPHLPSPVFAPWPSLLFEDESISSGRWPELPDEQVEKASMQPLEESVKRSKWIEILNLEQKG